MIFVFGILDLWESEFLDQMKVRLWIIDSIGVKFFEFEINHAFDNLLIHPRPLK